MSWSEVACASRRRTGVEGEDREENAAAIDCVGSACVCLRAVKSDAHLLEDLADTGSAEQTGIHLEEKDAEQSQA